MILILDFSFLIWIVFIPQPSVDEGHKLYLFIVVIILIMV